MKNSNNNNDHQLKICALGLYNWRNQVSLAVLEADSFDEVDFINVTILSGDETIQVVYKDTYVESFDPEAQNREANLFDGQYTVHRDEIDKWLEIGIEVEKSAICCSYERAELFTDWQERKEEK